MWLYCVFSPSNRKCEIMESNLVRSSSLIHSLGIYELCNFGQVTSQRFKVFFGKLVRAFFIDKFALSSSEAFFFKWSLTLKQINVEYFCWRRKWYCPCPTLSHPQEAPEALPPCPLGLGQLPLLVYLARIWGELSLSWHLANSQ